MSINQPDVRAISVTVRLFDQTGASMLAIERAVSKAIKEHTSFTNPTSVVVAIGYPELLTREPEQSIRGGQ